MTHVVRDGEFYVASYVTGPTHNVLRLKLNAGHSSKGFTVKVLPPVGECHHHDGLTADEMVPHIRFGVERANSELGTSFGVTMAEIVENDSRYPPVYELFASRIVRAAAATQPD